MKIEVLGLSAKLVCQELEFLLGQKLMWALCFVAERAGKVADVGYFKIYFFEHFLILLGLMDIFYHKICSIAIEFRVDKHKFK